MSKTKFYKVLSKIRGSTLAFLLAFTALIGNTSNIKAQTYQPINLGNIAGTGAEIKLGYNTAYWYDGLAKITINGEIAFCIEPTTLGFGGSYSKNDDIPFDLKEKLSLIVYYGWDTTSKTDNDYATTQFMIWEALGATITNRYGDFGSKYQTLKSKVQYKISRHSVLPNFGSTDHEVDLGSSLALNDKNDVLNNYHITSNGGSSVSVNGNKLVITPNNDTPENLKIELSRILDECLGASIAYRSSADNGQDVALFRVGDPYSINISVKVNKYGKMNISKQDEDGTYVPNTSFSLSYNADMSNPIGTYTTGADGTILVEQLLPKKVYIQEVSVPEPFILDNTIREVTIIPNDTVAFNASNIYKTGNLEIQKLDKDTGKAVNRAGAEFTIYKSDGTLVKTISTNDKGIASLTGIRWGDYYFVETKAPENYVVNSKQVPFKIRENGVTIEKSLSNKRTLGTVQLSKIDKETGKTAQGDATLEGAVYLLKAKEDIISPDDGHVIHKKGAIVKTMSIKDAVAKVENLYLGKYEIVEKNPSTGYLLDETAHDINLNYTDENKTVEIRDITSSEQVMKRAFKIIKISSDGESGTTPALKGAHFEVKLESEVKKVGWNQARTYDELVTDDEGFAKSVELPYGKYRVRETITPPNHNKVPDFFVDVIDDSREPMKWVVQNDAPFKTIIGIVKVDSETGDIVRLAGATFKIKNLDTDEYVGFWVYGDLLGKYVTEFTTNEDGNIMTPDSVRAGHYQIEEIKAPNGMLLSKESKPFTITDDGAHQIGPDGTSFITTIQFADAPAKGQLIVEKTADLFQGYEATETEYGTLYQPKFEEGLLSGVTYEIKTREDIKSADGTRYYYHKGDLVETLKTDGKTATKSSKLPLGAYTVQETACDDDGYVIDSKIYEFDLLYKDQETELVNQTMKPFNDKQRATATIDKAFEDSDVIDNADVYKDVVFGVFTKDDLTVNGEKVLDKYSMIQVVSLEDTLKGKINVDFAADYYLKELATDDQYVLSKEKIPFNFEYAGDKETVIEINHGQPIENKVKRGDIKVLKKDADTGKSLAGAEFELSRDKDFKTILATIKSGSDGYAEMKGIEKSTVYVREKQAPSGYAGNQTIKTANIDDDGQLIEVVYENKAYRGNLHIYKSDKETKENLSGIQYRVTAAEDIYEIGHPLDEDGNKIIKYHKGDPVSVDISEDGYHMTDELGAIHLANLPMGTYNVVETKTLEGYVLDPLVHVVTLTPENDKDALVEKTLYVDNDFTKVDIDKVDKETNRSIAGAALVLYNADTKKEIKAWVSTGKTMHFDRLPSGNYVLKETSPAEGYVTAEDMQFKVEANTSLQVFTMVDDFTKVEISKIDTETKQQLPDAELELYRLDQDNKKDLVEKWNTGNKAVRFDRLATGNYILHEVNAPNGYHKTDDIQFTVKETGEVQKIVMKDERIYTFIKVKKVDAKDHEKVLANAEFTMYSDEKCTKVLAKVTTGKNGIAKFDHLAYQTVYIKETKAPDGYTPSPDVVKVVIDDEWYYNNEDKTIMIADHIIEKVNTGVQSNDYIIGLFAGSSFLLAALLRKRKKLNK